MEYISVKEWAERQEIAKRTARNYCAQGKIKGAVLIGKTWNIPIDTALPERKKAQSVSPLLKVLREQKEGQMKGGIYHRIQIDFTYNSNHIEGSRLTHDQTRYIFETNTIGVTDEAINVDDIIETTNHFRAVDYIIQESDCKLTETYIKQLHLILKSGTSDERKDWFRVGDYKEFPNEVGGNNTTMPEDIHREMKALLKEYRTGISCRYRQEILSYTAFTVMVLQFETARLDIPTFYNECRFGWHIVCGCFYDDGFTFSR